MAANQKFKKTTILGRFTFTAIATSITAMILAINSAATGPTLINFPRKALLSSAPISKPRRVVRMSKTCSATKMEREGAGNRRRVPIEIGKLIDDDHSGMRRDAHTTLSFVMACYNRACMPLDLKALASFDTPTICNTIELFEVRPRSAGYMDSRIRACFPEMRPAVGYAATVTMRCAEPRR